MNTILSPDFSSWGDAQVDEPGPWTRRGGRRGHNAVSSIVSCVGVTYSHCNVFQHLDVVSLSFEVN